MKEKNSSLGNIYNIRLFVPPDLEEIYNIKINVNALAKYCFTVLYKRYNLTNEVSYTFVSDNIVRYKDLSRDSDFIIDLLLCFDEYFDKSSPDDFKEIFICFAQESPYYFTNSTKILAKDWINIIHNMIFRSDHKYKDSLTRLKGIPFFKKDGWRQQVKEFYKQHM